MRTRAMEFPRSLKQLKEFRNSAMFNVVGDNTDHFRAKRMMKSAWVTNLETLLDLLPLNQSCLVLIRTGLLERRHEHE